MVAGLLVLAGGRTEARGLTVGETAPVVSLQGLDGVERNLVGPEAHVTLLLYWRPGAARSLKALCALAGLAADYESLAYLSVVSGPADRGAVEQAAAVCDPAPAILLDPARKAFQGYQIVAVPTLFVLSPERRILCKSAGMGSEGQGRIMACLDTIYNRHTAPRPAENASPRASRKLHLAERLLQFHMADQADKILKQLTTEEPAFRPAWVLLAYRRIEAGDLEAAAACLAKARELDGAARDVAAGFAWVWWKKGDETKSADWAARVPPEDPHRGLLDTIGK